MLLFFVTVLGLFLRLSWINKPEGLWNDEYVSWYVSATPFHDGFWSEVFHQCHMPLYYVYLKPFVHYSDIILRLTSVLPGILAIPVMYLVGKEFPKRAAIYASCLTSFLSFLVYYSQEVRFYSLLFLFSALSLLFTVRLVKNNTKVNVVGYIIATLLILATHVLGIIYCFFNLFYLICKKKIFSKSIILIFSISILLITPLGLNILKMLPASQWWGNFSYTNILFLFSDFFSPILTNNINAPPVFFYNKNIAIWMCIPTIIALAGILYSRMKNLLFIALCTIIVMSIISMSGHLVFITKYAIEILPILILATSIGFCNLSKAGAILFTFLLLFHFAAFFTTHYPARTIRAEGNNIPATIINFRHPNVVIYTYYAPNRFKRYQKFIPQREYHISKINRYEYKDNPEKILDNVKHGETVSVVFLNSVSFINQEIYELNKNNPKIPEMFLIFSNIKNRLVNSLNTNFSDIQIDTIGSWTVVTARKN